MTPRHLGDAGQIGEVGDRALRVRRRGEIENDGAREQRLAERIEVGEEFRRPRGRQVDHVAIGRDRAGRIGGVERIGHEDRGLARTLRDEALRGERAEKEALARAVEHQHLAVRIRRARQAIAPRRPLGRRFAEMRQAFVPRIAAEVLDVRRDDGRDEIGNRVLGFADAEIDDRLAGLDAGDEVGETREGRARVDGPAGGRLGLWLAGYADHDSIQAAGRSAATSSRSP